MKKIIRILFILLSTFFVFYLLLPNPTFPEPPSDALQSNESADTETSEQDMVSDWKQFVFALWDNVRQLVVIRRNETGAAPLLVPQEQYFLYQNLQLKLESTRLSLLKGDTTSFHSNIDTVTSWLSQYFDTDAKAVNNMVDTLTKMKQVNLSPALPELSSLAVIANKSGATD